MSQWVTTITSRASGDAKNIAHVGSFSHFVFVFVFVLVFVKCNAMTLFVYIYSLLDRILKLIYMGRLPSWMSLSLSSCLSLCVSLSVSSRGHHWIVRVMSFLKDKEIKLSGCSLRDLWVISEWSLSALSECAKRVPYVALFMKQWFGTIIVTLVLGWYLGTSSI